MSTSPVEIVLTFSTGLVAFALAVSGTSKVGYVARTLGAMSALRIPSVLQRSFIARLLPFGELLLSLGLFLAPGMGRQAAGALAAVMLAIFTAMLIAVLQRGEDVDCGCFGALTPESRVTLWSVGRNAVLLFASVVVALFAGGAAPFATELFTLDDNTVLLAALAWAVTAIAVLTRMVVFLRRAPI